MEDKWKILRSVDDIIQPGIYQEKLVVVGESKDDMELLKSEINKTHPDAEFCEVPEIIKDKFPYAWAAWVNKHDPHVSISDINQGLLRVKIN